MRLIFQVMSEKWLFIYLSFILELSDLNYLELSDFYAESSLLQYIKRTK